MRRLICLGIVAAAVLAIPTAQAVRGPAVTLSVSKFQVRYGDPLHLAGTVSNHKAGVSVGVFSRAFTASGFSRVATVVTGPNGRWTYDVKPGIATTYQARTGGNESRTLLVGVRPAVTLTQLDDGRLRVEVGASRSFAGRSVKIQKRDAGVWSTLAQLRLNAAAESAGAEVLVRSCRCSRRRCARRSASTRPGRATSAGSARRWSCRRAGSRSRSRRRRSRSATRSCSRAASRRGRPGRR